MSGLMAPGDVHRKGTALAWSQPDLESRTSDKPKVSSWAFARRLGGYEVANRRIEMHQYR
jgi:hypothetical protein